LILLESDITRVVQRVLDAPMIADRAPRLACRGVKPGQIVCHLRGGAPEASPGTSVQDVTGDADDTLDQVLPFGVGNCAGCAEYINGPGLTPISCFGDGGLAAGWLLAGAGGFGTLDQGGLIVFQLDNRLRLGLRGNDEGFFGSAAHQG
jgi:hypothetical protein